MLRRALPALLLALAACRNGGDPPADGGNGVAPVDGQAPRDALPPLSVDFTVVGCPHLDPAPVCTGRAPLTLQFVPITSGLPTRWEWDFGDGKDPSNDRIPAPHTYALPGRYDVKLVGVRGTEIMVRRRPGFVVVTESGHGESCDVSSQCAKDLFCLCGSEAKCIAAFGPGRCASACASDGACPERTVCADLSRAAASDKPEPWARALCVPGCSSDEECPSGTRCRVLPGRPNGWVLGCFSDYPMALGAACRGANGRLTNTACVTGLCADLGANGLCSIDCSRAQCAPGTACGEMNDGRKLCLVACSATMTCDADPLLACTPANPGPLGFTVADGEPTRYCAPRRCSSGNDCGATGTCVDNQDSANCARRSDL
jgi:hypothetical protein